MEAKYKFTTWYWIKHFFWNLKQIRLLSPCKFPDTTGKFLRWRDLPFCAVGSWRLYILDLVKGRDIPRAVVFVGAWMTKKDIYDSIDFIEKHKLEEKATRFLQEAASD